MRPHERQTPPGRAGFESRNVERPAGHLQSIGDPVQVLLARLDTVRQAGAGWTARCPAHEDRTASLSIATGTDGRVLLHCFAGCPTAAVVQAVGLSLPDLFPRRLGPMTPQARRELSAAARLSRRIAALNSIAHDLAVVEVAAAAMVSDPDDGLSLEDYERVCVAHQRIAKARREVAA